MKLAQIQMHVTADKAANLRHAEDLLRSVRGADMAILPEMFCCPYDNACFRAYGEPEGGPAYQMLSRTARELNLWLVGGSLPELDGDKIYNTAYVFDPTGTCVARHRKMHLFDIDVQGGQSFRESATLSPGNDITLFDTPYGRIGLCICFDLRFEELCRLMALEGARVLLAPAAFNMTTGPAHWELLLRQRAVDNQCFTVGAAPARDETASYVAWGHSLVCDPWGTVLHECGSGEETAVSLGIHVQRLTLTNMVLCCLTCSIIVSRVGLINFIGLVAPHIVRMVVGNNHVYLIPGSVLAGAVLLLLGDLFARVAMMPIILPIGAITSFLGGPLFLYLLFKGGTRK